MNYGNNLKYIRTAELCSQDKVADTLGIARSTYKEYELQNTIIPIKHLIAFCDLFNVSIDYILNLSNDIKYYNINKVNSEISGKRLKEFRKENKLTQLKLAKQLNIARSMLSEYEKGHFLISTHTLYDICKKYNISADYLLGRIDNPKYLKNP